MQQTCSRLLAWVALPWRCSLEGGWSRGDCPDELGRAAPERARCSSTASMVSPVCTVPPEKLGAVCSGPVDSDELTQPTTDHRFRLAEEHKEHRHPEVGTIHR